MKGVIIRSPWIEMILSGEKSWEIRGSNTKIRGKIALIRSGSGLVVGRCELVDVVGPLTLAKYQRSTSKHRVSRRHTSELPYKSTYAWVLKNAKRLRTPIPYEHPQGAVIWVNLPDNLKL